jgi:hypothetical protein
MKSETTRMPYYKASRCQKHRMWMKKGNCELCIMEREAKQKEYERMGGSNKPPIKITKV